LLVSEAIEIVQHDDLAKVIGQFIEGALEGFGIGFLAECLACIGLTRGLMNFFVERLGCLVTARLLNHGKTNIAQNRHQPGLAVSPAEAGKGLVSPQIGILHRVFGVLIVAQEPAGKVISGIQMRQENLLKFRVTQISSPS